MADKDWHIVFSTTQSYQAYIIQDLLKDHDIEAVVIDKQDSFYVTLGEIEVYVEPENVIKAKHLVKKADF
ncbi:MAG: hypothetical protein C0599_04290 [Salinivirgaceae bacterium]|nr:MAG: hypothetical protein C0599_04290 [Salinivirgaceae bacterium]